MPLVCIGFLVPPVVAQTQFRYTTSKDKITINGSAGHKGFTGPVQIPSTINGLPVTSIGGFAFYLSDRMTGVIISNGVTDIGANAFSSCSKLTYVELPDSLTNIGFAAFSGCYSLTNITIPKSVIRIGQVTFSHCVRLNAITVDPLNPVYNSVDGVLFNKGKTKLIACPGGKAGNYTIPDGVTEIDDNAFRDATHLTSIKIPDSVTTIEWHSFNDCIALTNVTIGRNVNTIGDGETAWITFSECPNLEDITVDVHNPVFSSVDGVLFRNDKTILIKCPEGKTGGYRVPENATKIGAHSFSHSVYLTGITTGANVRTIEDFAFEYCSSLIKVGFGNNLKTIGNGAFASCTNLFSIAIPDSVTEVGNGAFSGCTHLTNALVGKNVTSLGAGCFSDCRNLQAITVDPRNSTYSSVGGVLLDKHEAKLVKCPEGKKGSYTIPSGVKVITGFYFSALNNIIVPKSVKQIEGQAFLNCRATAIYFEGNAPRIVGLPRHADALAFANCGNLTIYHHRGTHGWKAEFAGRPTALWK